MTCCSPALKLARVILDKLRQRTQAAFLLRIDTLDLNGAHVATALHQPGEINVRRRGNDPLTFSTFASASFQLVHGCFTGSISPCGTTARMRLFSSRSKPFIALRPTINTATPSAIPMVEITEISDTMPPRRRPRLKRRAINNDNGESHYLAPSGSVPRQMAITHLQLAVHPFSQLQVVGHHQKSGALGNVQFPSS